MKSRIKYNQSIPISKRAWFLILRLVFPALLVGSSLVFLRPNAFNYALLVIYSILALVLFLYPLATRNDSGSFVRSLIIALISSELLIEGLLVNHAGGNFSPFVLFFIITIVTASLFFHLLGSIVVATLAGLVYSLPIFFDLSAVYAGLIDPAPLAGIGMSSDEAFYTVFLHLCLFYFCAFISGYLAENLFLTSRELSKIRLETNEILEQMHSGLLTLDAEGRIIYFNQAAGEILAVDDKRAKGNFIEDVLHSGLKDFSQKLIDALLNRRPEMRAEINIRHPQKGIIPVGLSSSVLTDDEGDVRGLIAVFQDLTEAKKFEARLRASDRLAAVGRLAAGIAHEIRNPLASISGSVEILKDDLQLSDGDDLRLLELILKESSRLNTILSDFLNFARVSRAGSARCNLSSVILEVVALSSTHQQPYQTVQISHNIHRPNIFVGGSEDQIKQVLWNLMVNSFQAFEGKGGRVHVSTRDAESFDGARMLRLEIADDGPGVPADIREKIFEPFFSTKKDGTGLGLPIVARIVDCLGGRIELESTPDWNTIFVVYLPMMEAEMLIRDIPRGKRVITIDSHSISGA
jgi:two-component system sensor histidine kinase PilS (NtrC family)